MIRPESLYLVTYKTLSMLVGFASMYLGYLLFMNGVFGPAADLEAEQGGNQLRLLGAAPGVFFALFGAVIVALSVYRGLSFAEKNHNADTSVVFGREDREMFCASWTQVTNLVEGFGDEGKLSSRDLELFRMNMAGLAYCVGSLGNLGRASLVGQAAPSLPGGSTSKESDFRGFGAPNG